MSRKTIMRIAWAFGTAITLCICFLLCRFVFLDLHGSYQYPAFLFFVGFAAVIIAAFFDGRKIMICTVVGYIGGFALGVIFGVDGVDQGGGATNNWWWIWTVSFIALIFVGILWEIINRYMQKKKQLNI